MKYYLLIFLCFLFSRSTLFAYNIQYEKAEDVRIVAPVKPKKNKKKRRFHKKRIQKNYSLQEQPFPLYALLSVSLGVLAFGTLFLHVAFPAFFLWTVAAALAIAGLVLGIVALKKGNSKSFSFVGIMLTVIAILGTLLIAASMGGAI